MRQFEFSDHLRCDIDDGVAVMTVERPPVNAYSSDIYRDLGRAAQAIADDEAIRVVILTAVGRMFSAGADVKELRTLTATGRQRFFDLSNDTRRKVAEIPVPVIAAINGPAVGAGVAYATYCDYRIAAEDAFFAMPEINLGSVAGGGIALHAIGVPTGPIRWMLFSGSRVTADVALSMHLIDELAPSDRLMAVARDRAAEIANKPRRALVEMKQAIALVSRDPRSEQSYAVTQRATIAMVDPDRAEGLIRPQRHQGS